MSAFLDPKLRAALAKAALAAAAAKPWREANLHDLAEAAKRPVADFWPASLADAVECAEESFDRAMGAGVFALAIGCSSNTSASERDDFIAQLCQRYMPCCTAAGKPSMSSTTAGGSFAIGVGNTAYGKAGPPTDPSEVKAYRAPKYVPPGGADTQPEVISEVKGTYPEEAKKNEIEGTVLLKLTIDENGNVTEVKVIKGLGYGLDEASVAAIRKFKFKPATKDGENVVYSITYNYSWYLE